MRHYFSAGVAIAALIAPVAVYAQETTSSMRGTVTAGGAPVAGAQIKITHVPTGTVNTVTSSTSGGFVVNGLRVGGPFTVSVVADGYADYSVTDIFTQVGIPFAIPLELSSAGDEIVVTASRVAGAGIVSQGPSTVLTAEAISTVASLNRDIRDLSRRDPFATLDPTNSRAVSFAGQNPRFNRFSVDGVGISDNFGLNPDGLPSRRGPVPLDAIGQYQVKIAPYEISEGNFQGGAINVVLKSGTNEFQGTGFYTYNSDKLTGDTINGTKITIPKFKSEDFGLEISGPIIKDKLFFMVAGERVRAGNPITEGPVDNNAGAPVPNLTSAIVSQVQQIVQSRYNYTTGGVLNSNNDKDDRLVAKIDANLSDTQRFSLTGTYTKDSLTIIQNANTGTAAPSLGLASNGYKATNRLYTGIAQINSEWSDSFSTELRGFYKDYVRGQDPFLGRGFAQFQICTAATSDRSVVGAAAAASTSCPAGVPQVFIGPDISRQSNALNSQTYGVSFSPRLTLNGHDVKLLAEYQHTKIFNQFLQRSAGDYYFDSLADLQAGTAQRLRYQNAVTLNPDDAAARFAYEAFTFGIQDSWHVADSFNLTYGIRYDVFGGNSAAALNPNFVARYGFRNNTFINGRGVAQPRIGFDWKPLKRLSIRGGVGIFSGGAPDVYVSNSFSNTGILTSSVNISQNNNGSFAGATAAVGAAALTGVTGTSIPSVVNQLLANVATVAAASTNALDPNFKVPSQYRATLSTSYDADLGPLGDHWLFGIDLLYSEVKDQVAFTDIRSVPTALLTPDGRVRYTGLVSFADSNSDIFLTNTKKGRGFIAVARFDKSWDFGLNVGGSYTRQRVTDQAPATSSTALSNYQNGAFLDANIAAFGTSNDEVRNQFKYYVNFEKAFFGDYKTKFSLFGETRSGRPFSYTFLDPSTGRSPVFGTIGSGGRYLAYIPTGVTDPLVSYDTAATAATIDAFISSTGLNKFRGKIAPRNGFRSPSFTKIDLHIEQELPGFISSRSKFSIFADIENVGNLISNKWGRLQQFNFPFTQAALRVACLQAPAATGTAGTPTTSTAQTCAQYRYSSPTAPVTTLSSSVSLYQIRVGARFTF